MVQKRPRGLCRISVMWSAVPDAPLVIMFVANGVDDLWKLFLTACSRSCLRACFEASESLSEVSNGSQRACLRSLRGLGEGGIWACLMLMKAPLRACLKPQGPEAFEPVWSFLGALKGGWKLETWNMVNLSRVCPWVIYSSGAVAQKRQGSNWTFTFRF